METLPDDCLYMVFDYLSILDRLRVENGMYLKKYINLISSETFYSDIKWKGMKF